MNGNEDEFCWIGSYICAEKSRILWGHRSSSAYGLSYNNALKVHDDHGHDAHNDNDVNLANTMLEKSCCPFPDAKDSCQLSATYSFTFHPKIGDNAV